MPGSGGFFGGHLSSASLAPRWPQKAATVAVSANMMATATVLNLPSGSIDTRYERRGSTPPTVAYIMISGIEAAANYLPDQAPGRGNRATTAPEETTEEDVRLALDPYEETERLRITTHLSVPAPDAGRGAEPKATAAVAGPGGFSSTGCWWIQSRYCVVAST
jgi:hypothetical protein